MQSDDYKLLLFLENKYFLVKFGQVHLNPCDTVLKDERNFKQIFPHPFLHDLQEQPIVRGWSVSK